MITVSDRAAAETRADETGPFVVEQLRAAGFEVPDPVVIADGEESVGRALAEAVRGGTHFVLTLGGTGVAPRDRTPEGTAPHLVQHLPGIAEEIRRVGAQEVRSAVLSRGLAGVAEFVDHRTLVVNLAGSAGAARDGLSVLVPLIPHLVEQLSGGDHG